MYKFLRTLGIGSAATILNIVVITAAVSAINSDVFGAGTYAVWYVEVVDKHHKCFKKSLRNGVPWMTVVVMAGVLLIGVVLLNYLIPENVFLIIASIATFATVWVWLMILLSQVAMRRKIVEIRQIKALDFPVIGWPYAPAFAIAFMLFILAMMGYFPDSRPALICRYYMVGFTVYCIQRFGLNQNKTAVSRLIRILPQNFKMES